MATLYDVEQFIERNSDICRAGQQPASPELIDKAERFLDVRFPDDYREFLKRWGTLSIGPFEFYGLCGDDFINSSVPDAIWFTNLERKNQGFPKELVVFYNDEGDEYYCLDTSNSKKSHVVVWDVIFRKIRPKKPDSLFDLILDMAADFA